MTTPTARLARQLSHPTGRTGRTVVRVLNRLNRAENAAAVAALEVRPGDRALDLGFGGGVGLTELLGTRAASVCGVELSQDAIACARRRFAAELGSGRLRLARGCAGALPFPAASFDRVVTVNTLYFWSDPAAGVREIARVLAPGGRLVVGIRPSEEMRGPLFAEGFRRFSGEELEELLRALDPAARVERAEGGLLGIADRAPQ